MSEFKLYGFTIISDDQVYEPSDDTFLLADAIIKNSSLFKNRSVLEIGCGTGLLSLIASRYAKKVTASDINPHAVTLTQRNIESNKIKNIRIINSDLFNDIKDSFDIILFNTPYLPQSSEETLDNPINSAWDGGPDGRKVIRRFLSESIHHLNQKGILLFLESSLSGYQQSIEYLKNKGLCAKVISTKKLDFEELVVIMAKK